MGCYTIQNLRLGVCIPIPCVHKSNFSFFFSQTWKEAKLRAEQQLMLLTTDEGAPLTKEQERILQIVSKTPAQNPSESEAKLAETKKTAATMVEPKPGPSDTSSCSARASRERSARRNRTSSAKSSYAASYKTASEVDENSIITDDESTRSWLNMALNYLSAHTMRHLFRIKIHRKGDFYLFNKCNIHKILLSFQFLYFINTSYSRTCRLRGCYTSDESTQRKPRSEHGKQFQS